MKQLADYRINGLGKRMCLQGNTRNTNAVATKATSTTSTSTYTSNNNNKNNNNRLFCL
jgi:hypothetical protein